MNDIAIDQDLLSAAVERLQAGPLAATRKLALEEFLRRGLPDRRDEDWKYTSLSPVAELSNAWLAAGGPGKAQDAVADSPLDLVRDSIDAHWITLTNGRFAASESLADLADQGLSIAPLSGMDGTQLSYADDALSSLNAALLHDGLRLLLRKGCATDKPIGLLITDSSSAEAVRQERIVIDLEEGASLQIIECHASSGTGESHTNAVLQIGLDASSTLEHVRIQHSDDRHLLIGKTHAQLAADARYRYATFDFGARLARNDVVADINGPGALVEMHGLYLATGKQHIDNHTRVNHRFGPALSSEEYRGILNGSARCVFNGKAVVFEGADGTDAHQSNHNLLLSQQAEIDTKPELEIYADDVKCSHGATVGQLDESALFYLRSRGIGRDEAAKILTRAFAAVTVRELPVSGCREFVEALLEAKLEAMDIS
jgi:Fe-S cluster assembly protein SufD